MTDESRESDCEKERGENAHELGSSTDDTSKRDGETLRAETPTQMLDARRDFRWRLRLRGTPSSSLLHPYETTHHGPDHAH